LRTQRYTNPVGDARAAHGDNSAPQRDATTHNSTHSHRHGDAHPADSDVCTVAGTHGPSRGAGPTRAHHTAAGQLLTDATGAPRHRD